MTFRTTDDATQPVDRTDIRRTVAGPAINGMLESYVVLSDAECARGFVRPVRHAYVHEICGSLTRMGRSIAETYARDPEFYGSTYCCACQGHYPVGPAGEFVWDGTTEKVGT